MKIRLLFILIACICFHFTYGQNKEGQQNYASFIQEAEQLYDAKDYQQSAEKYKEAFDQIEGKAYPNDRYNAACSYTLAADAETSFYHLFRLANSVTKFSNYDHITRDTDLNILHKDKQWEELIAVVKANKEELEKDFDKPLVAMLDTIHQEDQSYRMQIDAIEKEHGRDSKEMQDH